MFASHRFTKKGDWCRRGRATTCSVSHSAAQGTEMNRLWSFGGKRVGNAQLVSVGALAKIGRLLDKFGQTIIFDAFLYLFYLGSNHLSINPDVGSHLWNHLPAVRHLQCEALAGRWHHLAAEHGGMAGASNGQNSGWTPKVGGLTGLTNKDPEIKHRNSGFTKINRLLLAIHPRNRRWYWRQPTIQKLGGGWWHQPSSCAEV